VGARGLDAGSGYPWINITFAYSSNPFIGMDEYNYIILSGRSGVSADIWNKEYMAFYVGYLHIVELPVALLGLGCNWT
tara:strand:+ start:1531 stop:1764 length:234 start_codon:yes stop_codon:yes gene_type:complete